MKIERINENQIRCTLTRDDLASRNIHLNELAYGSSETRNLFQDMMKEAHAAVGFDTGNSPLMIEAIPTSSESITLVITKVEDPEELDTRFSRFTRGSDLSDPDADTSRPAGADEILDLFNKIYEARKKLNDEPSGSSKTNASFSSPARKAGTAAEGTAQAEKAVNLAEAFIFSDLDQVIQASRGLHRFYTGKNTLYRHGNSYHLVLHASGSDPSVFNKVCNLLSEYGEGNACSPAAEAFLQEHGDILIRDRAVQKLDALVEQTQ